MAVERGRVVATFYIVMGCYFLIQAGVTGFDLFDAVAANAPTDVLQWLFALGAIPVAVGFIVCGILMLRSRRKRIAAFNAEHGVDAGRQPHSGQ
jgi:hypothetical protein